MRLKVGRRSLEEPLVLEIERRGDKLEEEGETSATLAIGPVDRQDGN
jgi:hypothetical protein